MVTEANLPAHDRVVREAGVIFHIHMLEVALDLDRILNRS